MSFETPGADRALAICIYLPASKERDLEKAIAKLQQTIPDLENNEATDLIFTAGLESLLGNPSTSKEPS